MFHKKIKSCSGENRILGSLVIAAHIIGGLILWIIIYQKNTWLFISLVCLAGAVALARDPWLKVNHQLIPHVGQNKLWKVVKSNLYGKKTWTLLLSSGPVNIVKPLAITLYRQIIMSSYDKTLFLEQTMRPWLINDWRPWGYNWNKKADTCLSISDFQISYSNSRFSGAPGTIILKIR